MVFPSMFVVWDTLFLAGPKGATIVVMYDSSGRVPDVGYSLRPANRSVEQSGLISGGFGELQRLCLALVWRYLLPIALPGLLLLPQRSLQDTERSRVA